MAILFLIFAVCLSVGLGLWSRWREQLDTTRWSSKLGYHSLVDRVKRLFLAAEWAVEELPLGVPASFKTKKDGVELFLVCIPSTIPVGPAKIKDLGFYRRTAAGRSPLVGVCCDMPNNVCVDDAIRVGVFLTHFSDLPDLLNCPASALPRHFDTLTKQAIARDEEAKASAPTFSKGTRLALE